MKILPTDKKVVEKFSYLLGNVILSILLMLLMSRGSYDNLKDFLVMFVWFFSICFTQSLGLGSIYKLIDQKIPWMEAPVKKVFVQLFAFLLYSIGAFILVMLANYYIWMGILPAQAWNMIVKAIPYTVAISLIISLVFTAIGFFFAWKRSVIQSERLKSEMMAYKYEALRNQINPHFLFNSLNVLSDLVYDDQATAVKFIRQLSDLFRYVLDSRDKELVPLKDEMEFIRSFIFLLQTRFEDKLKIVLDVQPDNGDYIVPMTLQLLIENAVKHNEVSETYPLCITVRKKNDYLEVINALRPKNVGEDSKKTGLKNIAQQFAFFCDRPIEILPTAEQFKVRIPILKLSNK